MRSLIVLLVAVGMMACQPASAPRSATGVKQARAEVSVQASGLTIEQENIRGRLEEDNKPGSVKHLYVISAYSGDVILYSTVRGKVTSSGKRLTPYAVRTDIGGYTGCYGFSVAFPDGARCTAEVLQDDGTYGSSEPYVFWWDSKGVYHQHYISGGQILHVSNAPMRVGKVTINVESE